MAFSRINIFHQYFSDFQSRSELVLGFTELKKQFMLYAGKFGTYFEVRKQARPASKVLASDSHFLKSLPVCKVKSSFMLYSNPMLGLYNGTTISTPPPLRHLSAFRYRFASSSSSGQKHLLPSAPLNIHQPLLHMRLILVL